MKQFLIFIILLFNTAYALDVVYPTKQKYNINAKTVFFVGNIEKGKDLKINSKPAKIWNNNMFVEVLDLKDGDNTFVLKSGNEEKTYNIYKKPTSKLILSTTSTPEYITFPDNAILYTKTIDTRTPIREKASNNAKRLIDLPKNTVLFALGKKNGFYKLLTGDKQEYWVNKTALDVKNFSFISKVTLANIYSCYIHSDNFYDYIELNLSYPIFYTIEPKGNNIKLTLHGAKSNDSLIKTVKKQKVFKEIELEENFMDLSFNIKSDEALFGYLAEYKNNKFIFKKTKSPKIKPQKPLANLNICIDAGHGGSAKGAIGPTRVNEKDINLEIAMQLASELSQKGANIIMSRISDIDLGLYERVDKANANHAHMFISIHANSLPDGKNPYEKHGTSVFYFNNSAKILADIVKQNIIKDTGLRDDGTNFGNFAVIRTTMPLAILIETAYMINPEEYMLLQNPKFQRLLARSIANSIEIYARQNTK